MEKGSWTRAELQRVAQLYYVQEETMEAIAARGRVSRSTVSRQLKEARRLGIVRISVLDQDQTSTTAQQLGERYAVRAHVVPVRETATESARLTQVARMAGRLLSEWMDNGTTLGIAWGTTMSTVVEHLVPKPTRGATVVQLNGAVHSTSAQVLYVSALLGRVSDAFEARPVFFPVPAFFDDPATKAALWRERSVSHVVDLQHACDIAAFGVGSWQGGSTSQVYAGGYLTEADLAEAAAEGAVGDICTVFLRADGSSADIGLNARGSGPSLEALAQLPRRLCVVAGLSRVPGTVGALRAGVVTDLVVDEQTAEAVLAWGSPTVTTPGARRSRPVGTRTRS